MSSTIVRPSVNALAAPLVEALVADAARLRLAVRAAPGEARLIDAGAAVPGSIEAGRRIAEICLGGLGTVTLAPAGPVAAWPFTVTVHTADPVLACLGSQYAGWSLADEEGKSGFFALGSGPGRAAAAAEPLFEELHYRDGAARIVLVLESGSPPPPSVIAEVARAAGLAPGDVTFVYAPTQSLAGATQVVARVLEVALHKAHAIGFDLGAIVDGIGAAPLSPPHPDFIQAMGRTNDAIIYGGRVQLFVEADDGEARALAQALPSATSRDHGAPFAEIFARFNGDFYAIDKHLFSPAEVVVTSLRTGTSHRGGRLVPELVERSFA
ncbi:Methenyltetrahydromethanopterin cyclohydrolase [Methylobacterium crusticola]|uniref:Methenyltetrahydromethanopterin cyclohydrolase n=1 Tax=Methylobacterium crusticola TaxID=1697972 RepID=A0ABQ4R4K0_9HYPH|nr:methenyltetrahydromethanopterin cyclohydrolase [Methylobacterium crusticola]GJD52074.1 Methenyltetrahydromethanopterin cyclohydrolase [Methylobacterium crusticola]